MTPFLNIPSRVTESFNPVQRMTLNCSRVPRVFNRLLLVDFGKSGLSFPIFREGALAGGR